MGTCTCDPRAYNSRSMGTEFEAWKLQNKKTNTEEEDMGKT